MKREVFISYKSDEYDLAMHIYDALQKNDITVWMAPQDIPSGSSYAIEITNAIKDCQVFLLLLSNAVQTSQWVPKELDAAINEKKRIIPFMVEKCSLNPEFGFFLSNVQFRDAYTDPEGALNNLIKEIRGILGKPEPVAVQKEEVPAVAAPVISHAQAVAKVMPDQKQADAKKRKPAKSNRTKGIIIAAIGLVVLSFVLALAAGGMGSAGNLFSKTIVIAGKEVETSATYLTLSDVVITQDDMQKLNQLAGLSSLTFENCQLDAPAFTESPVFSLRFLTIKDCNMTQAFFDSVQIGSHEKLLRLDISGNPAILTLQVNENELTSLQTLNLAGTSVEDPGSVYENCAAVLTELDISGTKISDISFLANNRKIKNLGISDLGLSSLQTLNGCIYIEELYAAGNPLESTDGLENMTLLRVIDLSGCGLEQVEFLGKSTATLTHICLQNNALPDLSVLQSCTQLKTVNVSSNKLTSISFLQNSTEITTLLAADNEITSADELQKMTAIATLDLSGNKLTTIAMDNIFAAYADIYLQDNELTTVSLTSEKYFGTIALQNNKLENFGFLNTIKASELFIDYSDAMPVDSMKSVNNVTLYDCPLDKQAAVSNAVYGVAFATSSEE